MTPLFPRLCTDDFTGRLANNTNLAAKGVVALEAYSELCHAVHGKDCAQYSTWAADFAKDWVHYGTEHGHGLPHVKIAFNYSDSYSLKYNLVWQKLLNLSGQHMSCLCLLPRMVVLLMCVT